MEGALMEFRLIQVEISIGELYGKTPFLVDMCVFFFLSHLLSLSLSLPFFLTSLVLSCCVPFSNIRKSLISKSLRTRRVEFLEELNSWLHRSQVIVVSVSLSFF